MTTSLRRAVPVVVASLSLPALAAAMSPAVAADLLSHRAAYRLSLADRPAEGQMSEVMGGLVLETRAACDGWINNQRLGFVARTEEGRGFTYDVRFSSWESADRRTLRFTVKSYDDGKLFEEFKGEAALDRPGGQGKAAFSVPGDRVVALPAGTLFPTEHVRQLIAHAEQGERFMAVPVFDGSGDNALSSVSAVIGQPRELRSADGATHRGWPMSLAYHSLADSSDLPEFEISFTMREDGVVEDIVLDYGEFALKGDLEKLESLPAPACG
jgi:hypothetical protein